ncbi:Dihydrolipoyllysine-residue acetyltransferase component of acetoin cleaving system [Falsiruegeria litorea R37]|uniref:Dihydrolipoyllysine-residue acetyltransferase component of acetoin cleaving system n=1 Tax=Falsiruegeria litorea R37 TaxID=1200284 RepID=A0A1Y5SCV8_9RHOB|nr:Dihydrolipoyllysine-residue acetyltransferase component of acetoin cleaving system [Falsiruegeria litorea R37]
MVLKALISLLALVIAGVAITQWKAARNEARAETSHPPPGQFIDVDGIKIHAMVAGNGPDLVLIHGSSGSTRDMSFALAPALTDRYRVILFDRPGHGFSQALPQGHETITDQARVLSTAAVKLGAKKPIVMGQSYGGAVALAWAVNHPDRIAALVPVSAPSTPWATPLDPYYQLITSTWGNLLVVPLITAFVPDSRIANTMEGVFAPQAVPSGYLDHFNPRLSLRRSATRANARQRANLLDEVTKMHPRYPEISVPTEIVHGDADDIVSHELHSKNLVMRIPGAVLTLLPGIGHMPQHVSVSDVTAAIDRAAARTGLR